MIRLVLLRFSETYFRHRWLYLLPLGLMAVLAGVYQVVTPPVYEAAGTMYVQNESLITSLTSQEGGFSWVTPAESTASELGELLKTDAFARAAISQTPLEQKMQGGPQDVVETITEFREAVTVSSLGDNLVAVNSKHEDPQVAQQAVRSVLESYVQWKLNADNQDSIVAQDFFAKVLAPYREELAQARADLRAYLISHPDPVRGDRPTVEVLQIADLQAAVDEAQEKVKDATEKMENARLAQSKAESELRQSYAIVDAPLLPTKPTKRMSTRAIETVIFVVVGLMLSVFGVIGGVLLDRTVRLAIDARLQLNMPLLGMLPDASARVFQLRERLPQIVTADTRAIEALLRAEIVPAARAAEPQPELERAVGGGEIIVTAEDMQAAASALLRSSVPLMAVTDVTPLVPTNGHSDHATNGNGAANKMQQVSLEPIDEQLIEEVQRRYDTSGDPTERLHYQIVMLAHRGRTPDQISDTVFYSRDAVEFVIRQFMSAGVEGIPRDLPNGLSPMMLPEWEAELLRVIDTPPSSQGVSIDRWTTKRLSEYLAIAVQVRVKPETISLCLHRHGYVCRNRVWRREHQVDEPVAVAEPLRYRALGSPDDFVIDN